SNRRIQFRYGLHGFDSPEARFGIDGFTRGFELNENDVAQLGLRERRNSDNGFTGGRIEAQPFVILRVFKVRWKIHTGHCRWFVKSEKSKSSRNVVSNCPAINAGSFMSFRWKGIVVWTPSMTNSSRARLIFLIARSRVLARTISFAIMES